MIRRNHIEAVIRMERPDLRTRNRETPREERTYRYVSRGEADVVADESSRATSSNKKYHQYKDWKGYNRNHLVSQSPRQDPRKAEPLAPKPFDHHLNTQPIRKEYDDELGDAIRKEYTSNCKQEAPKRRFSTSNNSLTYNYLACHQKAPAEKQAKRRDNQVNKSHHKLTFQNSEACSPVRQNNVHQAARKYSSVAQNQPLSRNYQQRCPSDSKCYTPLFEEIDLSLKIIGHNPAAGANRYRQNSKATSKFYDYSSVQMSASEEKGGRTADSEFLERVRMTQTRRNEDEGGWGRMLPVSEESGEEVSSKLRKISVFNNQINQRIKSIISSFEELRKRL